MNRRQIIEENFRRMREEHIRNQEILRQQELMKRELQRRKKPKSKINFDNILPQTKERNMGMDL